MALEGMILGGCSSRVPEDDHETTKSILQWINMAAATAKARLEELSPTQTESFSSGAGKTDTSRSQQSPGFLPLVPFLSLALEGNGCAEASNNLAKFISPTDDAVPKYRTGGIPATIEVNHNEDHMKAIPLCQEIFDPVVPLRYGHLDTSISHELALLVHDCFAHLEAHKKNPADLTASGRLAQFFLAHPGTCYVRYPHTIHWKGKSNYLIDSTALTISSKLGCLDIVKAAYRAYPEAVGIRDRSGQLPLHYAAAGGHSSIVQFLLSVFPQAARELNREDATPLHLACRSGTEACLALLVEAYPSATHRPDKHGWTPQHYWVQNPSVTVNGVKLVAPKMQLRTNKMENPLHVAVTAEAAATNAEILDVLRSLDNDWVEQVDCNLQTCLHRAVASNHVEAVAWLIAHYPFAIHRFDDQGRQPRDLATNGTHSDIREMTLGSYS